MLGALNLQMTERTISPAALSLIAQIGALGEAASGVRALIWLVRLMLSLRMADGRDSPFAGLWSMLWQIASGKLKLRGFDVSETRVHRGLLHLNVVRIAMRGAPGERAVFSVTVEFEIEIIHDIRMWNVEPVTVLKTRHVLPSPNFAKSACNEPYRHGHFVTIS
jgi:hypothetical protein